MASKKSLRARARRNIIRGLVKSGVKINPNAASAFTQEQLEQKRLSRFRLAGLGNGRGKKS